MESDAEKLEQAAGVISDLLMVHSKTLTTGQKIKSGFLKLINGYDSIEDKTIRIEIQNIINEIGKYELHTYSKSHFPNVLSITLLIHDFENRLLNHPAYQEALIGIMCEIRAPDSVWDWLSTKGKIELRISKWLTIACDYSMVGLWLKESSYKLRQAYDKDPTLSGYKCYLLCPPEQSEILSPENTLRAVNTLYTLGRLFQVIYDYIDDKVSYNTSSYYEPIKLVDPYFQNIFCELCSNKRPLKERFCLSCQDKHRRILRATRMNRTVKHLVDTGSSFRLIGANKLKDSFMSQVPKHAAIRLIRQTVWEELEEIWVKKLNIKIKSDNDRVRVRQLIDKVELSGGKIDAEIGLILSLQGRSDTEIAKLFNASRQAVFAALGKRTKRKIINIQPPTSPSYLELDCLQLFDKVTP